MHIVRVSTAFEKVIQLLDDDVKAAKVRVRNVTVILDNFNRNKI